MLPLPSFPSTRLACALSALALAAACQSPEAMLTDADEEAYELLDARRAELFDGPAGFRIERPGGSLRARLLAGQPAPAGPHVQSAAPAPFPRHRRAAGASP